MMLKQRIITALLLGLPIVAVLLYAPPLWITVILALIMLLGAWEWSGFIRPLHPLLRFVYVVIIACIMAIWFFNPDSIQSYSLLFVAVLWWIAASAWVVFFPEVTAQSVVGVIGILVLLPMWIALVTLVQHLAHGGRLILALLLIVAATDIGAYFTGRALGKHKLAPRVSPGKTWEGVGGGLLSATLIALVLAKWLSVPATGFVVLCLVTAGFSIIGDLTESLFKRHAGLKDSGSILPGHGGVLDRIDSITAAAPVFVYGLMYLNAVMM